MQTQLKLMTSDFYIMHSKQVIVYDAQGYSAPVLKAGHLVSCLCVRVRVCGGGCLFVGLWVFSYAIHMYIRGKIHRSMAARPLYPLLLMCTTPSLRDSRYLTL